MGGLVEGRGVKLEGWVAKQRDGWLSRGMGGQLEGWVAN
jgi:hypothetical protein